MTPTSPVPFHRIWCLNLKSSRVALLLITEGTRPTFSDFLFMSLSRKEGLSLMSCFSLPARRLIFMRLHVTADTLLQTGSSISSVLFSVLMVSRLIGCFQLPVLICCQCWINDWYRGFFGCEVCFLLAEGHMIRAVRERTHNLCRPRLQRCSPRRPWRSRARWD